MSEATTSGARVLLVGGGARNHALAEALRASPSVASVVLAPGTSGLERRGWPTAPVATQDLAGLVELAEMEEFDLTVVGPNTPLVDGLVDRFEAAGLPIFGPTRAAARLEGSKVFARMLVNRLGIAGPRFAVCDTADRALHLARTTPWARVFKADGIAYGKGVRVTQHIGEAEQALRDVMEDNVYGLESRRIVVEERLDGREVTVFSLTDGRDVAVFGHVLNYPRLLDGDRGPPTRGMGQVAPAPPLDDALVARIEAGILRPTVAALADAGTPLRGALFVDLMLVRDGPVVIDFNVRFGDPATQTLLTAYRGDLYAAMQACRTGDLAGTLAGLVPDARPRVSVVAASAGYPGRMTRGAPIRLDDAFFAETPDVWLFEDGVRWTGARLETTGGRTFTVVAAADDVATARDRAYAALTHLDFPGMQVRRDIGAGV